MGTIGPKQRDRGVAPILGHTTLMRAFRRTLHPPFRIPFAVPYMSPVPLARDPSIGSGAYFLARTDTTQRASNLLWKIYFPVGVLDTYKVRGVLFVQQTAIRFLGP